MAALSAEGIILRKYYLRETSYVLIIFTKEFGKIRGVLKGARDPYPQFAGNFEIFTRCKLLFYKKKRKGMDLVTRCEAVDFFLPVRKDIERLAYASYFVELADMLTADHDVNEELYRILAESLRLLSTEASAKRTARIFELKFLSAAGFSPQLDGCTRCSSSGNRGFSFSAERGGLICGDCAGKMKLRESFAVFPGTINFMRKVKEAPFSTTARIKVSKDVGSQTEKILKSFMRFHIGREFKSLRFLEKIEKKGVAQR